MGKLEHLQEARGKSHISISILYPLVSSDTVRNHRAEWRYLVGKSLIFMVHFPARQKEFWRESDPIIYHGVALVFNRSQRIFEWIGIIRSFQQQNNDKYGLQWGNRCNNIKNLRQETDASDTQYYQQHPTGHIWELCYIYLNIWSPGIPSGNLT